MIGVRKITMVIGEPCVGKSAIMRQFILQPNRVQWTQHNKPFAHLSCERLSTVVLGRYDEGQQFPGTDRLSMSVQPVAQRWIDQYIRHYNILFEGDRLGNLKMARHLIDRGYDFLCVVIATNPLILDMRRGAERHQPEPFVKGRATKIANIVADLPPALVKWQNNDDLSDIKRIANWLWQERA